MKIDEQIAITVPITNTGKRIGSEIVQLYISDLKSSLPRPDKQALSFFNDSRHEWVAEPGKFEAQIAASATDIKSKVTFELE